MHALLLISLFSISHRMLYCAESSLSTCVLGGLTTAQKTWSTGTIVALVASGHAVEQNVNFVISCLTQNAL